VVLGICVCLCVRPTVTARRDTACLGNEGNVLYPLHYYYYYYYCYYYYLYDLQWLQVLKTTFSGTHMEKVVHRCCNKQMKRVIWQNTKSEFTFTTKHTFHDWKHA